ncbi:MAG: transposase [Acidobacteriota bacterium]|nr:transposase [Acidobacteriota bacterium]
MLLAIDGTKVQGNASRERSRSYRDLQVGEQKLRERMQELLTEAAQVDAAEAAQEPVAADTLPSEYASAQGRLQKILAAKAALEQRARDKAEQVEQEVAAAGGKPAHEAMKKRQQRHRSGEPAAGDRHNFTDPDSRLMKQGRSEGFVQGFNAQLAVDTDSQVIVAALVTQKVHDREMLLPMVRALREQQMEPRCVVADAGYSSGEALTHSEMANVDASIPPDGGRPGAGKPLVLMRLAASWRSRCANGWRARRGAVCTRGDKPSSSRRLAASKEHRHTRRFSLRGLAQVQSEWMLIWLTHNLLKLHKNWLAGRRLRQGGSSALLPAMDCELSFPVVSPGRRRCAAMRSETVSPPLTRPPQTDLFRQTLTLAQAPESEIKHPQLDRAWPERPVPPHADEMATTLH